MAADLRVFLWPIPADYKVKKHMVCSSRLAGTSLDILLISHNLVPHTFLSNPENL